MKIGYQQLNQSLKKSLAGVYLVTGDEILLRQEACLAIGQTARQRRQQERQVLQVDSQFNWQQWQTSTDNLSLFANAKLIELQLTKGKLDAAGNQAIVEYCQRLGNDDLLIISSPKLEAQAKRSAWVKAVDKVGIIVEIWPISQQQLPTWLAQRMKQAGLQASREAVYLLAEKTAGNLLATDQAIKKLALVGISSPTTEDIIDNISDQPQYNLFNLVDKTLAGATEQALKILFNLAAEGTEPSLILWALKQEIKNLIKMHHQQQQGIPMATVLQNFRVWPKRKALIRQALSRLNSHQLYQLMAQAETIDWGIKGISSDDPWQAISHFILVTAPCEKASTA
jgi:DNA polymerase-3 subunit delta